jgi:hypothetical protein
VLRMWIIKSQDHYRQLSQRFSYIQGLLREKCPVFPFRELSQLYDTLAFLETEGTASVGQQLIEAAV